MKELNTQTRVDAQSCPK